MCIAIGANGLARQAAGIPSHHGVSALVNSESFCWWMLKGWVELETWKWRVSQEDLSFQGVPVPYETSVYVIWRSEIHKFERSIPTQHLLFVALVEGFFLFALFWELCEIKGMFIHDVQWSHLHAFYRYLEKPEKKWCKNPDIELFGWLKSHLVRILSFDFVNN